MKPDSTLVTHLLNHYKDDKEAPAFANTTLKLLNAPLLQGWDAWAACANRPEKPTVPEHELPVNAFPPDARVTGYRSLFQASASAWNSR